MKSIMKQASFWENRHVEPFYRSPVVSDEEEWNTDTIYGSVVPAIGKTVGAISGGIAGAYVASKNGGDVMQGLGVGAAAGFTTLGGASDIAGSYLRNKKIIKKRRDAGQPIYGDFEKAHYSAGKAAPSLPVRNVTLLKGSRK